MNAEDKEFQKRLLATFKTETKERLKILSDGFLALEKRLSADEKEKILEVIYREVHSLKGDARSVNLTEIELICRPLETVMASLKRGDYDPWPEMFETLYLTLDTIDKLITSSEGDVKISKLIEVLNQLNAGKSEKRLKSRDLKPRTIREPERKEAPKRDAEQVKGEPETVRISQSKLDELFRQTEEMLSVKQRLSEHVSNLSEVMVMFEQWRGEWAKIHPKIKQLSQTGISSQNSEIKNSRLVEFLDWDASYKKIMDSRLSMVEKSAEEDHRSIGSMVTNLLEEMKKTLLFPFWSLFEMFPRMVRDLATDGGKEVRLIIEGGDVEIDRRILEEMRDPFIHILRNSIDHGVEKPDERLRLNKPQEATITIRAIQSEDKKIDILISDDGAGINPAAVKSSALKRGLVSLKKSESLNDRQILSLIFQSEVSTSAIITDISGRGLGLAIVKEKVEKLGGTIAVETHLHKGTTLNISLPLTLATFRGVLVRTAGRLFMVPTTKTERVIRIKKGDIKTVENRETIPIDGQALSLVRLDDVLEISRKEIKGEESSIIAVILSSEDARMAFIVDEIIYEQEGLVKNLGKQISHINNIAGATVLGSGEVVPILNVSDLIKSAIKAAPASTRMSVSAEGVEDEKRSILVVEDSVISRMLLKNILESAGYRVETAVDGMDAYTSLREGNFDIVISDVEMPRMDGFDLTSKIRSDRKLEETPVVLVTALDSRKDRERGIDVGADAYIVKSSFDQSNLLDVVRRLA